MKDARLAGDRIHRIDCPLQAATNSIDNDSVHIKNAVEDQLREIENLQQTAQREATRIRNCFRASTPKSMIP